MNNVASYFSKAFLVKQPWTPCDLYVVIAIPYQPLAFTQSKERPSRSRELQDRQPSCFLQTTTPKIRRKKLWNNQRVGLSECSPSTLRTFCGRWVPEITLSARQQEKFLPNSMKYKMTAKYNRQISACSNRWFNRRSKYITHNFCRRKERRLNNLEWKCLKLV
jgi:hypothetical protein